MMNTLLFYYCLILTLLITFGAAFNAQKVSVIPLILIIPITLYLLSLSLGKIQTNSFTFPFQKSLGGLFLYYSFVAVAIMSISGLVGAKNIPQLISGVFFLPLLWYFATLVLPKKKKAINIPVSLVELKELSQPKRKVELKKTPVTKLPKIDIDRRQFLKLIGSAGLTVFMFSIFAKKAQAAFFGSVPGPGTVAVKDSGGNLVDPAISTPTDGYKITEIDDSTPAYYGYLDKAGKWFIMKESTGAYRYVKGASSFTTNWTNRAALSYDYFDAVF